MDPNIKLILDKIEKLGDQFTSLESRVDNLSERYTGLESKTVEVTAWRSEVDSSMADLVAKIDAVGDLADKVEAAGDLIVKAASVDALKSHVSTLASRMDRVVLNHGGCVGHPAQTGDGRGDSFCQ
jgi:outer membrane murein-binding lipoprotein Lpp